MGLDVTDHVPQFLKLTERLGGTGAIHTAQMQIKLLPDRGKESQDAQFKSVLLAAAEGIEGSQPVQDGELPGNGRIQKNA